MSFCLPFVLRPFVMRKSLIGLSIAFGVLSPAVSYAVSTNDTKLNIVTSVAPITNIVQNVAGERAIVTGIVPEGVNSHTFEPAPSDAKKLRAADIIFMNGLHLELPTIELAEQVKKKTTPINQLGNQIISKADWRFDFSFPEEAGNPNPHLWPNIALAMRYAELTRDALVKLDPEYKSTYFANTTAYLSKLSKLDAAIFDCVKSIPAKNRKLVTYHDSYAYFAPRYGMTVIGAIQPADFSEPTPREVVRIIKQLRAENVPAVFGSEVFESKILKQIAKEAKAVFIDQLADDDLPGEAGDSNHTFIGMMANNMKIMAGALGGDATCADHVDVSNISGITH
ncbi:MAG: metal ABC transporter substrate-binding protein [Gammaproteobacteria bacterium]|nr:metal ABC transporter substrate-binding protein [Gammaproteobacteria bacterium]